MSAIRDRRQARRTVRAMRRVLASHDFTDRPSTANDWQEVWTREGCTVVVSRLAACGEAEVERHGNSRLSLVYSAESLAAVLGAL